MRDRNLLFPVTHQPERVRRSLSRRLQRNHYRSVAGMTDCQGGIINASSRSRDSRKRQLESAISTRLKCRRIERDILYVQRVDRRSTIIGHLPGDLPHLVRRRRRPDRMCVGDQKQYGEIARECSAELQLQPLQRTGNARGRRWQSLEQKICWDYWQEYD